MLRCVVICAVLFCCVLVKAATFSGSYIKYAAPRFAIQPQYVSTGPAVPGGPLVRIPGTFGGRKDYAPAHYVSQFAKVFDRMRRSGRSTQESFVAAKSDLRARGLAPWVWQDGKLRRVESPALSANSVSEVPREKVVSYQRTPAALQPAPPVFEDFSYVQHLGQDSKDVALVFSEYSKFIDENLKIGHDEARKHFGSFLPFDSPEQSPAKDPVPVVKAETRTIYQPSSSVHIRDEYSISKHVTHPAVVSSYRVHHKVKRSSGSSSSEEDSKDYHEKLLDKTFRDKWFFS